MEGKPAMPEAHSSPATLIGGPPPPQLAPPSEITALYQALAATGAEVQMLRQALAAARIFGLPGLMLETAPSVADARATLTRWVDAGAAGAPPLKPWAREWVARCTSGAFAGHTP
jgi:hypothetical protein